MQTFKLIPFPVTKTPAIEITGTVLRRGHRLSIHYSMPGEIENIHLPAQSDSPARKHDLWKATCFEFFLASKGRPEYWEFNLSPSGNWNVYAMDEYRQVNMREEGAYAQIPFEFKKTSNELSLDCAVNLSRLFRRQSVLLIGITAVIQTTDGSKTYWALAHPGPRADFHLRESFVMEL